MSDSERSLFMPKTKTPGLCSVVCTTYNHAAYSAIALQSIFDQVYRNIEIVVIDDGSTDGNVDALKGKLVACPFPHQLITQSNSGKVGLNFNRALDAATGEYVCLLSLDDVLLPDCISAKMPILLADKHMTFVANTSNIEIGSDGAVINEMFVHPVHGKNCNTASQLLEHEYEHIGSFYVQGIVFRTDIIEAVGGFDPNMTGDDLILRTRIFRHMVRHPVLTFALLPSPGFLYRKHDQNLHRNSFRQLRTVLEWRAAYFPDRALPENFTAWANHFFRDCLARDKFAELNEALDYSPDLRDLFKTYKSSWKYRRKNTKRFLRRFFGIKPR